jgi:hypothetical protein
MKKLLLGTIAALGMIGTAEAAVYLPGLFLFDAPGTYDITTLAIKNVDASVAIDGGYRFILPEDNLLTFTSFTQLTEPTCGPDCTITIPSVAHALNTTNSLIQFNLIMAWTGAEFQEGSVNWSVTVAAFDPTDPGGVVPLPATLALLAPALGLMGYAGWRRRKAA